MAASPVTPGRTGSRLRRTVAAGVLALAMAATAACSGGAPPAAAEGGPVVLRFSWWGSDVRHQYTQQLIDRYEQANPNVTIEGDFTSFSDYWDRLATATAAGDAPDVMQQDTRYVREYADRGALLDLTGFVPGTIDTADLDPTVLPTGQIDGATFAIPTGVNAYSVVADPEAFAAAGVPLPDDSTWTWDEMVATAAQVTQASGGSTYGMQSFAFNDTSFEIFARQRGESLFTDDGDVGFRRETLVDWWNHVIQARDTGAEPPASVSVEVQNGGIDQSLTSTNRGALGFWWTNELRALTSNSGRDLQLLRWPGDAPQSGMYLKPAMFWSASATTEHPEEAARFIDYLVNAPESVELMLSDRGLPVNTELRAGIVDQLAAPDQQAAAFLEEIAPALAPPPPLPPQGAGEVQQIIKQLNEQVLFDQITVEEAADRFMSDIDAATS